MQRRSSRELGWRRTSRTTPSADEHIRCRIAGRRLSSTDDPEREVADIASHFGVSREVIAWQARNSAQELPPPVYEYLRSLVPPARTF